MLEDKNINWIPILNYYNKRVFRDMSFNIYNCRQEFCGFGSLNKFHLHFLFGFHFCVVHIKTYTCTLNLTGGLDPRFKVKHPVPTSDGFVFDTKRYTWIKITPMNTARMNHSLVSVNGMVYAFGGQDRNDR